MQKIIAIGNLGKDPEERITATGKKVTSFSLAVQVNKETTMWYDCSIWEDKMASFAGLMPYLKKGSRIHVIGLLGAPETYQAKDGSTKIRMRITPVDISPVSSGEKKEQSASTSTGEPYDAWKDMENGKLPF